ncbi:LPXTG cell wall anchor domain-containing protein [Paenarthrobacter ilicis]|uniref:DUF7507 domain-containing protein n=1 Tax=Paenarthrobacter ilicis TaxID=43665 RepID=UPI0028D143CC|nr:LPXTG cell wall anchor domain-containing protein [Paenarthrobacter ilicis]
MSAAQSWGRPGRLEKWRDLRRGARGRPRIPPSPWSPVSRMVATAAALAVAAGTLTLGVTPAMAAAGDFTVTLSAPQTVPLGQNYNYTATLDFEGVDSSNPATGVAMTTTLPEGTIFAGLPQGDSSPVLSHTYDPATRVLTITLKDTTKELVSVVYTVAQVDNERKYESMPLSTVITGDGGPSGKASSQPVTTTVTGTNNYSAKKSATTVTGSSNRDVTYWFNVCSQDRFTDFSSYKQKLSDVLPAEARFVAASSGVGTWDTSAWPAATWTNEERYDPDGYCLDRAGTGIWLTVRYPDSVAGWEDGQQPPLNTVTLETTDAHGVVRAGAPATAQGPVFNPGGGVTAALEKWSAGQSSAGMIARSTYVNGSYLGPLNSPSADDLVITDSGAAGAGGEEWYHHNDMTGLTANFSPVLSVANLQYTLEYQSDYSSDWKSFVPQNPTTNTNLSLTVQNAGSTGWEAFNGNNTLTLPVGSVLTGWRIKVAPGDETVPVGSEVRMTMGSVPVFRDVTDGVVPAGEPAGTSPGPVNNTATLQAGSLEREASNIFSPQDSVYLTTKVAAPDVLSAGDNGVARAGIVNQNPSETYTNAKMSVVLPCGIQYDPSKPIAPVTDLNVGVEPIPTLGKGLKIDSTQRVLDPIGCELQVITFAFDQISPMRDPGEASDRWVENNGWQYDIPVTALAKSYDPAQTAVQVESYAYTGDPRFLSVAEGGTHQETVQMTGYGPFFSDDVYDFDAARASIAKDTARVTINTAGGLLLDKLSGATAEGPWSLDTTVDKAAFWQVYVSNVLPNPVTGTTFFDRLPAVGTGNDFDVVLAGPVTGVPAGATVEYSKDAQDAASGTWTSVPDNATAFRVVVDTLASGEEFTLTVPTEVLGEPGFAAKASNIVTAEGSYNGASVQFATNQATVNVVGHPSLGIVKKTNGSAYTAAPGAIVAEDSEVTWTYEVTNTGDIPLAEVNVADAFTAGDGSKGTLAPTSADTGVLDPGATRVFTAHGKAVPGQYHNTATATAAALDGEGERLEQQPKPVSAESWYFAGTSGLSVVKTTNGHEVPAAPGPQLVPGSQVTWGYTVTNTGTLALKDVLVVDKDMDGNTVFSDVVASLAPGASVELTAHGKAVEGQYRNTVTASSKNPLGGSELTSSDDSFYFGAVPGMSVSKLVSLSPDGPWSESVTVDSGGTVHWQLSVTNTGNTVLTDVRFDDPALGNIDPVASLAPGETANRVVTQDNTTESYVNVVKVQAHAPGGETPSGSDSAEVKVRPVVVPPAETEQPPVSGGEVPPTAGASAPPAAGGEAPPSEAPSAGVPAAGSDDLPDTGAAGLVASLLGALALMAVGGVALVASRRRKVA